MSITYYSCEAATAGPIRPGIPAAAPTIVLAHGAGADSALLSWRAVLPELAKAGYTAIAPDLPGYGASARVDQPYSLPFYSDFIRAFIKTLGPEQVVLGGLSLGGGITLKAAIDEPQLLSAIIPVDAWGLSNRLPFHRLTHWYVNSALNRQGFAWTAKYPWIVRWSLGANLFGDKGKVTDELVDEVLTSMRVPGSGEPFRSFQLAEITPTGITNSLYDHMPDIALPTLLVHGSRDAAVPLKDAITAQPRFPNARLHIMEGCRHWPQKERPEEFASVVADFLKGALHTSGP
ncbi:MAG: alpha/beta fold hydrolase [Propionibacteriaceae bacterium]|nr:alpha/beta fold hydrolase [Propionibacteriaceae bacterium]